MPKNFFSIWWLIILVLQQLFVTWQTLCYKCQPFMVFKQMLNHHFEGNGFYFHFLLEKATFYLFLNLTKNTQSKEIISDVKFNNYPSKAIFNFRLIFKFIRISFNLLLYIKNYRMFLLICRSLWCTTSQYIKCEIWRHMG